MNREGEMRHGGPSFSPERVCSSGLPHFLCQRKRRPYDRAPHPKATGAPQHPKPKRKPLPKAKVVAPLTLLVLELCRFLFWIIPASKFWDPFLVWRKKKMSFLGNNGFTFSPLLRFLPFLQHHDPLKGASEDWHTTATQLPRGGCSVRKAQKQSGPRPGDQGRQRPWGRASPGLAVCLPPPALRAANSKHQVGQSVTDAPSLLRLFLDQK